MFGLKKLDITIIIISVVGIIFSFLIFHRRADNMVLVVYADDRKKVYSLDDADFEIKSQHGRVKVQIRSGRARLVESSCPDQWCLRMGWIDEPGESIVCLPSRIFLVMEDENRHRKQDFDTITR